MKTIPLLTSTAWLALAVFVFPAGVRAQGPAAPVPPGPLELKVMTFNIQAGAGARGGAAAGPTVAQGAAVADLNQRTMALEAAVATSRSALVARTFSAPQDAPALAARASDLAAAELTLALARADAFAAIQSGPARIPPAQVAPLVQQASRGGAGGGRGGANAATTQTSWAQRRDVAFEVLRRHAPDIVGTQEAGRLALDEIQQYVPGYGEIGVSRDNGLTRGEYVAILYRLDRFTVDEAGTFWVSETPEVVGSRSWNSAYLRIVTWTRLIEKSTGRAFYYYNTHLDNESQLARERGAQLLVQRIQSRRHPEDPFVVTGDLNAEEPTAVIQFLKGKGTLTNAAGESVSNPIPMIDTFRVLHPDQKDVRTRHDWTAERTGEKIDYVLASPADQVLEADILYDNAGGRYPSDHYPVMARIRIPAAAR